MAPAVSSESSKCTTAMRRCTTALSNITHSSMEATAPCHTSTMIHMLVCDVVSCYGMILCHLAPGYGNQMARRRAGAPPPVPPHQDGWASPSFSVTRAPTPTPGGIFSGVPQSGRVYADSSTYSRVDRHHSQATTVIPTGTIKVRAKSSKI